MVTLIIYWFIATAIMIGMDIRVSNMQTPPAKVIIQSLCTAWLLTPVIIGVILKDIHYDS
jgi:hypothetical protein